MCMWFQTGFDVRAESGVCLLLEVFGGAGKDGGESCTHHTEFRALHDADCACVVLRGGAGAHGVGNPASLRPRLAAAADGGGAAVGEAIPLHGPLSAADVQVRAPAIITHPKSSMFSNRDCHHS
jgi:hypothetical protein